MKDWQGREVPDDEPDDKLIWVWEVSPHIGDTQYTDYVERGWQDMLAYVRGSLDAWLESFTDDELYEGVTLTFRRVQMTVGQYKEITDGGE